MTTIASHRCEAANVTNGASNAAATSYTTASVNVYANRLYLLTVLSVAGLTPTSFTGTLGLTWSLVNSTGYNGAAQKVLLYGAIPAADAQGTITINFASASNIAWSVDTFAGVDTSSTVANAVVQSAINNGTSNTPSATLAAFSATDNPTFGVMAANSGATAISAGASFTQLEENRVPGAAPNLLTEWAFTNQTTVNSSTSGSPAWGAIGVELRSSFGPKLSLLGDATATNVSYLQALLNSGPLNAIVLACVTSAMYGWSDTPPPANVSDQLNGTWTPLASLSWQQVDQNSNLVTVMRTLLAAPSGNPIGPLSVTVTFAGIVQHLVAAAFVQLTNVLSTDVGDVAQQIAVEPGGTFSLSGPPALVAATAPIMQPGNAGVVIGGQATVTTEFGDGSYLLVDGQTVSGVALQQINWAPDPVSAAYALDHGTSIFIEVGRIAVCEPVLFAPQVQLTVTAAQAS